MLAEQHSRTFSERLADYPFLVGCLSRFRKPAEQRQLIEQAKKGRLDILIGTHRLLSKDVGFADLGLVVIDEGEVAAPPGRLAEHPLQFQGGEALGGHRIVAGVCVEPIDLGLGTAGLLGRRVRPEVDHNVRFGVALRICPAQGVKQNHTYGEEAGLSTGHGSSPA